MTQKLREFIYTTMRDDAVPTVGLRALLGRTVSPYGIYYLSPPEVPAFPLVTYFLGTQSGHWVRDITVNITAWGDNFEAVHKRIFTLLHNRQVTVSDYHSLLVVWDQAVGELFDEGFKVHYRQDRFLVKGIPL